MKRKTNKYIESSNQLKLDNFWNISKQNNK